MVVVEARRKMRKIIHGQIYSTNFEKLEQLSKDYSSCVRFCFVRFQKDKMKFNDVRNLAKQQYKKLNTRQISDATTEAQGLATRHKDNKVVFGGKKLWEQLKSKLITKKEWENSRNNRIYARGDKTKSGNPNLRIVGNKLRVTTGNRKFENYNLFVPNKFQEQLKHLLESGESYNVRLKQQDETHWQVIVDYEVETPIVRIGFIGGAIGVDTNIDRIAIAEISKDGNYLGSTTLIESRLKDGSTNKRNYDIGCLVKQIINIAKEKKKGIVFEDLNFKKDFTGFRKLNRIKSNFVWRKFIELLERKCIQHGINYKKVNPAYTSLIGKTKYKDMFGITTHESAAYVIARRGLGFNEKLSVYSCEAKRVKKKVMGTLAGKYQNKKVHSWVLWSKVKAVLTGQRNKTYDLQELYGYFRDGSESLSGEAFLSELIVGSNNFHIILADEGLPCKV
jgi:IS605 OrfB family transposase